MKIHTRLLFIAFFVGLSCSFFVRPFESDIVIPSQHLGNKIYIQYLRLTRGGYLILTGIRYDGAENIDYLSSQFMPAGDYRDVFIDFIIEDPREPGHFFEPIEPIRPGNYFIAELYSIKPGAKIKTTPPSYRDPALRPFVDAFGRPIKKKFYVTLEVDPFALRDACNRLPDKKKKDICVKDTMMNLGTKYPNRSSLLLDFCSVVDEENKQTCFRSLGELIRKWGIDSLKQYDICKRTLNQKYELWCTGVNVK